MKKKFEKPEIQIVELEVSDVIQISEVLYGDAPQEGFDIGNVFEESGVNISMY